jgi:hypothetical protein
MVVVDTSLLYIHCDFTLFFSAAIFLSDMEVQRGGHFDAHESERTDVGESEPAHEVDPTNVRYILELGVATDLSLRCVYLLVSLYKTYGKNKNLTFIRDKGCYASD